VLTVVCLQRHDPDVRLVMHTMVVVGTAVAALTSCGETSRRPHTPSNPQAARGGQAGDADAGSTASEAGTVAFGGATSLGGAGSAGDGLTAGGCATHALGLDDCDCSAEWLQLIDAGSSDRATSIAADSLGNLGVVGSTVDASQQHVGWLRGYGSDGGELWVETLTLGDNVLVSDVAAAPDGGWVVGGAVDGAGFVSLRDSQGKQAWITEGIAEVVAVAVDASGNVFIATEALTVTKLDPIGALDWSASAPDVLFDDWTADIAVDPNGGVAIVGSVRQDDDPIGVENFRADVWLRKLDADGAEEWVEVYDAGRDDWAHAVAIDAESNVLVAGLSRAQLASGLLGYEAWLRRLSPGGEEQWSASAVFDGRGGPPLPGSRELDVAVDLEGRAFVTWQGVQEIDADGSLLGSLPCRASQLVVAGGKLRLSGNVPRPNDDQTFDEQVDAWVGAFAP
jgi:hypothetical protein